MPQELKIVKSEPPLSLADQTSTAPGSFQTRKGGPVMNARDIPNMMSLEAPSMPRGPSMFGASGGPSGEQPDYSKVPLPPPRGFRSGMPGSGPVPGGVIPNDFASDMVTSAPLQAIAMSPVGRSLLYGLLGGAVGKKAGEYLFGEPGGYAGAMLGAGIGGYGGARGKKFNIPGPAGGLARLFQSEEPAVVPGAAREMEGGTAATSGPGITGGQAGPSQVRNATELSSHVARTRAGAGPTIYTPESLASEQGMSTAALGKAGVNLTIPQEQQNIMRLVSEGKVPMGTPKGSPTPFPGPPRPATATTAGPAQPGFSGLQPQVERRAAGGGWEGPPSNLAKVWSDKLKGPLSPEERSTLMSQWKAAMGYDWSPR